MTERPRGRRATKRELRVWAWVAGGLAFAAPWAVLAASPKPATRADATQPERPVVIVRRITRRIVVTHPAAPAAVRTVMVPAPAAPGAPSGGGSGTVNAAPPAPPATNTGGS